MEWTHTKDPLRPSLRPLLDPIPTQATRTSKNRVKNGHKNRVKNGSRAGVKTGESTAAEVGVGVGNSITSPW